MKGILNNIRKNSIFALVGFVVIGILLIAFPSTVAKLAGYIIGALAVGFGVNRVIDYFSRSSVKSVTVFGLSLGIIVAVAGIYIIAKPNIVSDFIVSVFGIVILADGITKCRSALNLKESGMKNWKSILINSAICILLGIVFIVNPNLSLDILLRILGGVFVFTGLSDLWIFISVTREYKNIINSNGEIEGKGKEINSEDK